MKEKPITEDQIKLMVFDAVLAGVRTGNLQEPGRALAGFIDIALSRLLKSQVET